METQEQVKARMLTRRARFHKRAAEREERRQAEEKANRGKRKRAKKIWEA